jgi:hypothetical protein
MTKIQNPKPVYDLEERTFQFVKADKFRAYVLVIWYWNLRFICALVLGNWILISL